MEVALTKCNVSAWEFAALPGAALDQSMTHEGERNLNFFAQGQDYSAA